MALHTSDPALADVVAALSAREPLFHRPGFGTTRAEADALAAADFVEIGASGRVYSREYVLGVVDERDRAGTTEVLEPAEVHQGTVVQAEAGQVDAGRAKPR